MTQPASVNSPQRRVAELLLEAKDLDLRDWMSKQRKAGASYDHIAHQLYVLTDQEVSVTYGTVRRWLIDLGIIEEAS